MKTKNLNINFFGQLNKSIFFYLVRLFIILLLLIGSFISGNSQDPSGSIKLTNQMIHTGLNQISFDLTEKFIYTTSKDGSLKKWDIEKYNEIKKQQLTAYIPKNESFGKVLFSKDKSKLYAISGNSIYCYNLNEEKLEKKISSPDILIDFDINSDYSKVVTINLENMLQVWDLNSEDKINETALPDYFHSIKLNSKNDEIIVSSKKFQILKYSLNKLNLDKNFNLELRYSWVDSTASYCTPLRFEVKELEIDNSNKYFATTSLDKECTKFVDLYSGKMLKELKDICNVKNIKFSPDNRKIAFSTFDNKVILFDLLKNKIMDVFLFNASIFEFNKAGTILLLGNERGIIRKYNIIATKFSNLIAGHKSGISAATIDIDFGKIATGSEDGVIKLWSYSKGIELNTFNGHTKEVNALFFNKKTSKLLSSSFDSNIIMWYLNLDNNFTSRNTNTKVKLLNCEIPILYGISANENEFIYGNSTNGDITISDFNSSNTIDLISVFSSYDNLKINPLYNKIVYSEPNQLVIHEFKGGEPDSTFDLQENGKNYLLDLYYNSNGQKIITRNSNNELYIYSNGIAERLDLPIFSHNEDGDGFKYKMFVSPNFKYIVNVYNNNFFNIYDFKGNKVYKELNLNQDLVDIKFSKEDNNLIIVTKTYFIKVSI